MSIVDIKYAAIGSGETPMKLAPKPKYVDDDDVNSDDDDDDDAGSYNDDDDVDEVAGIKKKTVLQKVIPSKKIGKSVRNDDDDDDEVDEDDDADEDDDESYYSENDSAKNDEDEDEDDANGNGDDDAGMKHTKHKRTKRGMADEDDEASGEGDSDDNPVSEDADGDGPIAIDDDEGDDGQDGEKYKKINLEFRKNYITETHPEAESHTDDEIHALAKVVRNKVGIIVDPLHKTTPLLTKYEKTRILGIRTKQLNNGATPYVSSKAGIGSGSGGQGQVIDGYTIALRELDEKKLPFIIRRPLPNGGTEYWYLQDLEVL